MRSFILALCWIFSICHLIAQDLELAILNYSNSENVLKYEKLEIGLDLPPAVLTKVNNFINNTDTLSGEKINPYLDREMRVFTEFIHAETGDTIIIDGFYTKEFESWMLNPLPKPQFQGIYSDDEYKRIGGWKESTTNYPFRIRFAPPKIGLWSARVFIEINKSIEYKSDLSFSVIESGNPGYVGYGENKRFLKHNGTTFFPVGCNLPWPETNHIDDPLLADYMTNDNNGDQIGEGYRSSTVRPRVYEMYRNKMSRLASSGGNWFRLLMDPSSTEFEWEHLGNYTNRLNVAQELDSILALAESLDVFLHWNMQMHYTFQSTVAAYYRRWGRNNEVSGEYYCYKDSLNTDNSMSFFRSAEAKYYYQQRIRYILARWGYSTNIGLFELFSEINNVGTVKGDSYRENISLIEDWQREMAHYIKSNYNGKIHILSTDFAGEKGVGDSVFYSSDIDVMASNFYDLGAPSFGKIWQRFINRNILDENPNGTYNENSYTYKNIKPFILSESGPLDANCDKGGIEIRRVLYQTAFSGAALSMGWDVRFHPAVHEDLGFLKNFMNRFYLDEEKWHPGSCALVENANGSTWVYKQDFADDMDGKIDGRERKADLNYLRSGDRNFAIGVISNKTDNIFTRDNCFDANPNSHPKTDSLGHVIDWDDNDRIVGTYKDLSQKSDSLNIGDESLRFRGMKYGKFYIEYYKPWDLNTPFYTTSDFGPKVELDGTIADNSPVFVIVRRKNETFQKR